MDNIDPIQKPFSEGYVLRTTTKHVYKSIDVSIRKTFERIKEFDGNLQKSQELFKTLARLHAMRKVVEEFEQQHQEVYND